MQKIDLVLKDPSVCEFHIMILALYKDQVAASARTGCLQTTMETTGAESKSMGVLVLRTGDSAKCSEIDYTRTKGLGFSAEHHRGY